MLSWRIWAAVAFTAVVVLLWPLPHSADWDIPIDSHALAAKRAYLSLLHERKPVIRPNILLLVADDLGRYDVSHYGHTPGRTPAIDHLARQGMSFVNAYATAAICAPSRAALLTGRYQNRFGFESQPMQRYVRNLGEYLGFRYVIDTDAMRPFLINRYPDRTQMLAQGLPLSEITLPEVLQAVGYDTAIFGKWHLGYGVGNHPLAFGFNYQYGFMEAFSLYADEADSAIESHHHDLFWERHIWNMGRTGPSAITRNGAEVLEARYLTDAIVAETNTFIARAAERDAPFFAYVPFSAPHTPFQARREDFAATTQAADHNERVYLAMIRRLDWAVSEITATLDQRQLLENTLIIFTSDNGGAAYTGATDNGPLRGGKFTQFEGGLEVPLFLYWQGRLASQVVERPVLLTDVFATVLGALDLPLATDRTYDSENLFTSDDQPPRHLFWRSDFNRAVRFDRWKLLHNKRDETVYLFDLQRDRGERNNLARQRPEIASQLMQALDDWETQMHQASWPRVMNYEHVDELGRDWFAI